MKEKALYCIWAILYAICTALGFLGPVQGVGRVFLVLAALAFFVPGALLLVHGFRKKDRKVLRRVRVIAAVSLVLTLGLLIGNLAVAQASVKVGNLMHVLLSLVSTPMLCGQYWVISLFLWACLLFASFARRKD
jgi:Na+-transporting methylmalonyl-CoA/oxaloacetate decarboxylase gamma subunit